ncbi:hypothetical protein KIN20_034222 [Parelaphostrongylus tenuis]|uniref:Uncharacterized protein n=1 Tax=Parelaphostrongylus tenuis TaxID=148309 RepID=A0AAD5WJW1_PARTN|nr:hypothetical protein KIN20_034222 [Parelaphostrongylus tenuis]
MESRNFTYKDLATSFSQLVIITQGYFYGFNAISLEHVGVLKSKVADHYWEHVVRIHSVTMSVKVVCHSMTV